MTQQTIYTELTGGLDLVTAPINRAPGGLIGSLNYEPRPEGYRRVKGIERYDGLPLASLASYWTIAYDAGVASIAEGATVTGATSGATGKCLVAATITAGSTGTLVLTDVTGTFQDNEALQVSAVTKCTANGVATERGALTDALDRTYLQDAIETRRALIGAITGSGTIRGCWVYNNVTYAFRDNAGATACVMWKSTGSGWSSVDLGVSVSFTTGLAAGIAEGATLTGATSAATGTVRRVIVTSGTFAANNAVGRIILTGVTGTYSNGEFLQVSASTRATASAASTAITLLPGGKYEFQNYNFYGASNLKRMYGCDGVNKAFEFDGTAFVPIITGMANDTPKHLACHKNYLFLAFAGGSLQFSALGNPISWSVVLGAGEIGLGDEITALVPGYQSTMPVFGRNKTAILYGDVFGGSGADASLKVLSEEAGCIEWTMQLLSTPVFVDDRGIRSLQAVQDFGNFSIGTLSTNIKPILDRYKKLGVYPVQSVAIRETNQYRLFMSNGDGLIMDMSRVAAGGNVEFTNFKLTKNSVDLVVSAVSSCEDNSGNEVITFGSTDGYVYRMESGTSYDGYAVTAYVRLPFAHFRKPTIEKRYHKATIECSTTSQIALSIAADFSYGSLDLPSLSALSLNVSGGGGFWDESNWSQFLWSQIEGQAEAYIPGIGTNISVLVSSQETYSDPHTLHGIVFHYSDRKLKR
jgi:hypothetical protein